MRMILLALAATLIACSDAPPTPPAAVSAAAPQAPPAGVLDEKDALLEWHVAWPAEVAAIPALKAMIVDPALKAKTEMRETAAADKAMRARDGNPMPGPYHYAVDVTVAGQSGRLLSLARAWSEFTGGAHPMHGTEGIFWDRSANRRISAFDLVTGGEAEFARIYADKLCAAIDRQRAEKRSGDAGLGTIPEFDQCPKLGDLAVIPLAGTDRRFDRIRFHADPYLLGPYAEGDYDVELDVDARFAAALKPEYREAFAAQPQ
ncbi:DUF4163 domain-containing protein [Sphingomonas sabuli]|uniref:DUF4163 domain-containing protein n=1 Tax=Sphingomonas sabuli TaxID=2764186 RepID=A0A7G9L4H7_9SPHN|nr:DUF4163 domain-containing protein [Sphingomonas sabuli]QNM83526.1 DUF4163 domain-containing protein [Sphingomonas sabuli]